MRGANTPPFDVAIAGAGPVGCTLALLLARSGRSVALIEPRPSRGVSALRPIALSYASRLILERAAAWDVLRTTPILEVDVSQSSAPGRTRFAAADAGLPQLGHVVAYGELGEALLRAARGRSDLIEDVAIAGLDVRESCVALSLSDGRALEAACVVHAEGSGEGMDEKPYGQDALLALLDVQPGAGHCAWERLTTEGPLALLPFEGRYAMVWGLREARARELHDAPEDAFLAAATHRFGARAGRFTGVRERWRAPLALRRRSRRTGQRQVYVGNAAQTLHPVAGQGLNLGLRDARDLARALDGAADVGAPQVLARYARARKLDAEATVRITDLFATTFSGERPFAGALRGAAMITLDACAPARRFFARRMVFGPSAIP